MKNILMITNIYPNNDSRYDGTPVCHYFTKEWIAMGYNVKVIHYDSLFPKIYNWVGKIFHDYIQAKTGCVAYTNTPRKVSIYDVDSVPVCFIPLKKYIPHKQPSDRIYHVAFMASCKYIQRNNFIPDVIVGHFTMPQLKMLHLFKQKSPQVKTCMVLHNGGENLQSVYGDKYKDYMNSIDVWGFRSVAFQKQFEGLYGQQKHEFLCYSGIPNEYIQDVHKNFNNGIKKFSFLGSLYKLKRVEDTIKALHIVFGNDKDYQFDIIGDGAEKNNLRDIVSALGMYDNVFFHGFQKRDIAQNIIAQSDCFVMVSVHEAFGLVYVEAMVKGCIVIATRGQGIDGVIIDGKNGFLCESENPKALADVIRKIKSLSVEELRMISENAINTAKELTNRKVAERYLQSLEF